MPLATVQLGLRSSATSVRQRATLAVPERKFAFSIRATSERELARRVSAIQTALDLRGGRILFLAWCYSASSGTHGATVHYEIPEHLT